MANFRLQKVLEFRRQREDQLRQRLAAAARARAQAEDVLAALAAEERQWREHLARRLDAGRIDAAAVQAMLHRLDLAERACVAQQQEVARRAAFEAQEREHLARAVSERRALDNLRERHEQREHRERLRREALIMEEIAAARTARDRLGARMRAQASCGRPDASRTEAVER